MAVQHHLVGEIFYQHGFAQAVRSDEHHVDGLVDEGEREQFLDQAAVALGRPRPVEVGDGFEGTKARVIEATFERAAGSLAVFDFDYTGKPRLLHQGLGLSEQAVEAKPAQALARGLKAEVWLA